MTCLRRPYGLYTSLRPSNWSNAPLRTALGRAYDHGTMKTASNRILNPRDFPFVGEDLMVVTNLRFVAQTFRQLQEDRQEDKEWRLPSGRQTARIWDLPSRRLD